MLVEIIFTLWIRMIVWNKNGRHDVEVNYNDILYNYKYYNENNELWL